MNLMQLPRLKIHQIHQSSTVLKSLKLFFPNYTSTLIQKTKIPLPLSQTTASKHSNVFTSTLFSSEGRAGEACEPSSKTMLFLPPHNKGNRRKVEKSVL
jgi:hypothetical protein